MPFKSLAATGLAAALLAATATNALAIRNRYTNRQAEGFAALLFEGFAPYGEDQPLYRPNRRPPPAYGADRGYDGGRYAPPPPYPY